MRAWKRGAAVLSTVCMRPVPSTWTAAGISPRFSFTTRGAIVMNGSGCAMWKYSRGPLASTAGANGRKLSRFLILALICSLHRRRGADRPGSSGCPARAAPSRSGPGTSRRLCRRRDPAHAWRTASRSLEHLVVETGLLQRGADLRFADSRAHNTHASARSVRLARASGDDAKDSAAERRAGIGGARAAPRCARTSVVRPERARWRRSSAPRRR